MNHAEVENLDALQVTLQQNPDSLTFARVADALMKRGRLEEAIQICEEGVKRHPQYVTGHMVLGKCYMQRKLYEQAEKEFKRVLLFDPKYLAAHRYYGDLMREIGWENTCEMSYRKILHIDPLDDKVRRVVEEFARKAESAKPAAAPAAPSAKASGPVKETPKAPAITSTGGSSSKRIPLDVDNLFEDADLDLSPAPSRPAPPAAKKSEAAPLRSEPAKSTRVEKSATKSEKISSAPPEPKSPSLSKTDEARFSSILDDIFQDEAGGEAQLYQRSDELAAKRSSRPEEDDDEDEEDDRLGWKKPAPVKIKPEEPNEKKSAMPASAEPLPASNRMPEPPPLSRQEMDFDAGFDETAAGEQAWQPAPPNHKMPTESFAPASESASDRIVQEMEEPLKPQVKPQESGGRDRIVTPTLGEIYAAQGQYAKAIGVFELLSKKDPANRHFRDKIDYLKKRLQETQNAG